MSDSVSIEHAAEAIRSAEALLIAAGAGMGVDSELPDYRGREGFWNCYPAYRAIRADYAAMTRPSGFRKDPTFAWGFYGHCLNLYRNAQPHDGYRVLRSIASRMPAGYFVLTTNIDGLFLKAGFPESHVHECHGSIHRLQCIHPCCREVWSSDGTLVKVDSITMRALEPLPRCRFCGSLARPAAFAFGDTTYVWEYAETQASRFREWKTANAESRVVVIECGSGPTVPGLRREGEVVARARPDSRLIRINPRDSAVQHPNDIAIAMPAAEALRQVARALADYLVSIP